MYKIEIETNKVSQKLKFSLFTCKKAIECIKDVCVDDTISSVLQLYTIKRSHANTYDKGKDKDRYP